MTHADDAEGTLDEGHSDDKAELIKYLREEAYAVRDCFTRYSVQVMAVSGGLLVAIAKFQTEDSHVGLLSFFPVVLILLVLQMGIHKYATSNRLLGYELHLQRTAHYISRDSCHEIIESVGWEEAMRAWRIVQPTLWQTIYQPVVHEAKFSFVPQWPIRLYALLDTLTAKVLKRLVAFIVDREQFDRWYYVIAIRKDIERSIDEQLRKDDAEQDKDGYVGYWFDQARAFNRLKDRENLELSYNPGGYLGTMMFLFMLVIATCFILLYVSLAQAWAQFATIVHQQEPAFISKTGIAMLDLLATIFVLGGSFAVAAALKNINSRVRILESGLLSIHSCAILWEAIVLAHLRSLENLHFFNEDYPTKTMHGYTNAIAHRADEISKHAVKIHKWIDDVRSELNKMLQQLHFQKRTRSPL
jgi:hypothetical protein